MSSPRSYEYARVWIPLYDEATLAVTRPVYLIEADDGFEGVVAEKNTTLMAIFNELGRAGWRIALAPDRVRSVSPEFQMLIDATLDEADGAASESAHPTSTVDEFDVYAMRRRTA